ncbi:MAG: type III-A CRISPR-associated RAMP protein Csm3 [Acholeplasmatales bacterium]|jgi:CRISPR-associated protein Csm3|nr:type III-A CRISPR-associated RAMP protein Csm3 [Acholeplasmatales bacterium]
MKKIEIKGILLVKTGLHIGGDASFSAIGSIDSPVIRNSGTGKPMIPGSSLKGKIRYLLAKNASQKLGNHKNDPKEILKLFGSDDYRARLFFFDLDLCDSDVSKTYTEGKYENTIDRDTCKANPRQIERVIPSTRFKFLLTYNVEDEKEIEQDFEKIKEGLKLLQADYLGGGGTRGNGRIQFLELKAESENSSYKLESINEKLKEICDFGEKVYK